MKSTRKQEMPSDALVAHGASYLSTTTMTGDSKRKQHAAESTAEKKTDDSSGVAASSSSAGAKAASSSKKPKTGGQKAARSRVAAKFNSPSKLTAGTTNCDSTFSSLDGAAVKFQGSKEAQTNRLEGTTWVICH